MTSSIQKIYERIAKGELRGFVVPAFNLRALTFDSAKALFRVAKKEQAGIFMFELARTEMKYTDQSVEQYVDSIVSAAKEENYDGPLFFLGDHYYPSFGIKRLIKKSIKSGFYNIDIDASNTNNNAKITAQLTRYIRKINPDIAIGGEISAVGGKNTNIDDFNDFIEEYNRYLRGTKGIIKVAVQTGTSHGGKMSISGEIEKADLDFKTLALLSQEAKKYGMAGAVQHGASTLPEEYFDRLVETGICEIHLATVFQNIVMDNLEQELIENINKWVTKHYDKKKDENDIQFIYRNRKRALCKFKKQINNTKNKDNIIFKLEDKFQFFIKKLKISGTKDVL